ncbi:MAG: biotin/lipoyl-containing protein, partial [Planctomycetota bacterium]
VRANASAKASAPDRLAQLERLVELMVQKDVVEVELEEAGTRWRVRRTEPQTVTYAAPVGMAMPQMHMPAGHMAAGHAGPGHMGSGQMGSGQMGSGHLSHGGAAATGAAGPAEPQGEVFKSPMLGTFYRSASPESEVFVKVGDRVGADRTLCIIEAMKVMNEIKAEREFEILEILAKNGEPVEFGQPLFLFR